MEWSLVAGAAVALAVLSWWPGTLHRLQLTALPRRSLPNPRRLTAAGAVGLSLAYATSVFGGIALLLGLLGAGASFMILGRLSSAPGKRRQQRIAAELPQVCDLLAVCLSAGMPLRSAAHAVAAASVGPLAQVLETAVWQIELGVEESKAWAALSAEPALATFGRELSRGAETGVSLTARLSALGVDARRAAAATAETEAKRVGVRSVLPLMTCFLPAFVLIGVVPIVGGMVGRLFAG